MTSPRPTLIEPDVIDDGVEVWEIPGDWDVDRDATSTLHGSTYRIGGYEITRAGMRALCEVLTSILTEEEEARG